MSTLFIGTTWQRLDDHTQIVTTRSILVPNNPEVYEMACQLCFGDPRTRACSLIAQVLLDVVGFSCFMAADEDHPGANIAGAVFLSVGGSILLYNMAKVFWRSCCRAEEEKKPLVPQGGNENVV